MFNLDTEEIQNSNTKKYLFEVISSLENGNYRSAIVMLYTTIIFDLINKLIELKDFHASHRATNILNKIQGIHHNQNRQYESIENTIINEIMKPASKEEPESLAWLLNDSAAITVKTVKNYRNLCAHPSFDQDKLNKLMEPNKDLVAGLIRSCIDDIFSQPANFGKDVFSTFMDDLSSHKDYFSVTEEDEDEDFKVYLEKKYFKKFTNDIYEYVVKNLFKEVYCVKGTNETNNFSINYKALVIMINNKSELSCNAIEESNYFDQMLPEETTALRLSHLFQFFPNLYKKIPDYWKSYMHSYSKKNPPMNIENYFVDSDNILEHIDNIYADEIAYEDSFVEIYQDPNFHNELSVLYRIYQSQGYTEDFLKLLTYAYSSSRHFDSADARFNIFIRPFLKYYDQTAIENLITEASKNNQCFARHGALYDHQEVYDAYNKFFNTQLSRPEFIEKFPNFCNNWQ